MLSRRRRRKNNLQRHLWMSYGIISVPWKMLAGERELCGPRGALVILTRLPLVGSLSRVPALPVQ